MVVLVGYLEEQERRGTHQFRSVLLTTVNSAHYSERDEEPTTVNVRAAAATVTFCVNVTGPQTTYPLQ